MALVGLLDAGRVLLIGPIFDRVLESFFAGQEPALFNCRARNGSSISSNSFRQHFQNPWTAVAFALVTATVLKGISTTPEPTW
jgi:ATP-binding cassette, subfamily B, bacterial MsbA